MIKRASTTDKQPQQKRSDSFWALSNDLTVRLEEKLVVL